MNSYNIDKCALELIVYSLRHNDFLQIDDIRFSDCTYHIGDALFYMAEAFSVHFQRIIRIDILKSLRAEQFISYALPRCLKLSSIPTHYNILLAFSFLIEIVTCLSNQHNCFKFLDAAKKCLVVIIRRTLYELRLWNGLVSYCGWRNGVFLSCIEFLQPIDMVCPTPYIKACVLRMIYTCCMSYEPIYLTRAESSILAIDDILDQEKENVAPKPLLLPCKFCGETCEVFAHCSVNAHLRNTRSANVDALVINSRLFRVLNNNTPPTHVRRILFE